MRISIIILTVLFFSLNAGAQENKMSLKQCIETALANNIEVKQSGLQTAAAEVNLNQAKSNLLPNLNGEFGFGFNQGRNVDPITNNYINQQLASSNVGLSSGVVLFNGLRLQNLIKRNGFSRDAAKLDEQQAKDNLKLNVILAYLQVLSNEDILAIGLAQLEVTKKQVERMDILVKEGAAGNYQLSDLKGQQANEAVAIINSENLLQQSKLELCQLMNINYNSELQLEKTDVEIPAAVYANSAAEVYRNALENFAQVKVNKAKIKSAATDIKVSKAAFFPTLSLNGNLFSNYSSLARTFTPTTITQVPTGDYIIIGGNQNPVLQQQQNYEYKKTAYATQLNNNLGTYIGINLQIPLFNRFQTKNNIKLSKINLSNTELESDNQNLQLNKDIEQAYLNMKASFERYKVLAEQVINFEQSFEAAEIRLNTGVINPTEYLISKNNLDRAKLNVTQAKYEYNFRTKVLDYFQGK